MQTFAESVSPRRGLKASVYKPGVSKTTDAAQPAGVVVCLGTDGDHVKVPASAANVAQAVGVVAYNPLVPAPSDDNTTNDFAADRTVEVVQEGEIWVVCEEAMAITDSVYCRYASGVGGTQLGAVRNDDPGSEAALLPNARVVKAATAAGVIKLRVNLPHAPAS